MLALFQHLEAQVKETAMSKLISRRGGYRYIYDENGHVEQVDELNAKMTNISLETWPDFESAKRAVENGQLKWRVTETMPPLS